MVVGVRHVVVGTLGVAAVVKGGIWLLDSTIWLQQPERRKKGERGSKATVSTHPKYSQARIYTTYATLSKEGCICGLGCRNARIERRPSPIED